MTGWGETLEPLDRVRSAVWGTLYADVADIVFKSAECLAKMTAVIVDVFDAAGTTVVREEDGNDAVADAEPDTPYLAARHRSNTPEV